tara:strand:+ start:166 stop:1332 length:1167 start_codon:yes stop_codon:yes gene_type:complete
MKWIGQHIVDLIARFRGDVYLEDVDTGTIASGGNLGLDSNNKIVKATEATGDITSVTLGTDGMGLTVASGEVDWTIAGGNAISTAASGGDTITIAADSASTTASGVVELATTAETTTGTDSIRVVTPDGLKDGYQGSTNVTRLGTIGTGVWQGTPITKAYLNADQGNITTVGTIATGEWRGTAINATYLDGQSGTNTGDETLASINALDITEVGTIDSGVWNGTAIATDQQKHLAYFEFEGFSVGDGTNYMIAELNSDTKAPFEHQTSTGSDGLTATGPVRLLKTAGHVMPYAGTLKLWKGWATSSGTGQTVDIGIYKATLVNNDADAVSPVVLDNFSFTSVGNSKALTFAETPSSTFAAGDILISAIRNGTNSKRCDFSSTLVVEWN